MNGILVVDKPSGMTSHDVVDACRRRLGVRRIGHAGTLDPPATGVLVVGVGRATRLLRFIETHEKEYRAEIRFGAATTTDDAAGEVIATSDAGGVRREAVAAALAAVVGEHEQVPPAVSAVKVEGERLYRKARRGEQVTAAPRRVTIYEADLEDFEPGPAARATVRLRCSKGTYVRSLGRDLGRALGVGAHVGSLRRLAVGPFRATDAVALDDVSAASVRPMEDAVVGHPRREVAADAARALVQGRPLPPAGIAGPYAVIGPEGLVGMAEEREGRARAICVVAESGS